MRADHLLRLHRQQVAVEHGGRLGVALVDGKRRHLDGEAAGLEHAALHVLHPLGEMRMAGVELRPGAEHADHRLAAEVLFRIAELHHARAVAEAPQVVRRKPAGRAQIFRGLSGHGGRTPAGQLTVLAVAPPRTVRCDNVVVARAFTGCNFFSSAARLRGVKSTSGIAPRIKQFSLLIGEFRRVSCVAGGSCFPDHLLPQADRPASNRAA